MFYKFIFHQNRPLSARYYTILFIYLFYMVNVSKHNTYISIFQKQHSLRFLTFEQPGEIYFLFFVIHDHRLISLQLIG